MRKKMIAFLLGLSMTMTVTGCASLTGVTNWKENDYPANVSKVNAFKGAKQALAKIGKVQNSDVESGSVNGECEQEVDAAVFVHEQNGKTFVSIKSKLNVKGNAMVIETGDRQKCIDRIAEELRKAGII